MDLFNTLFSNFSGGPESVVLLIAIAIFLWILGHYFMELVKWIWKESYPKFKKNESNTEIQIESLNYNKIFENFFREKIIILIEEQLKELKNYNKIFKENYEDNVSNMILSSNKNKDNEMMKTVLEVYEKITDLRERYAGKMATREDISKLSDEIRSLEKEISAIKQKINKNHYNKLESE